MKYFRLIYNLSIIAIIIIGIIKLFQKEYYLAFVWIILSPILLLLPRVLYNLYLKNKYYYSIVYFYELLILILLITSAGIPLGLKNIDIDFDSFSHYLNLTLYTLLIGVTSYLVKYKDYKMPNKLNIIVFTLFFTLIFCVILWGQFQYFNDKLFGTQMFFDKFQDIESDSLLDQAFGSMGVITGSTILYHKLESWIKAWRK